MTLGNRIALMREGKLMMLDTPYNVYHRPANVFTAKFIGSPATNIISAVWKNGLLHCGKYSLKLPDMWEKLIIASKETEFYLGIRPEHIHLHAGLSDNSLGGEVDYIEDYGNKMGIYFRMNGEEIISVDNTIPGSSGSSVSFTPDFRHIYIFEKKSENSIGYPPELDINISAQEKMMRDILSQGSQVKMGQDEVIHVHR